MDESWKATHVSPFYEVSNMGRVRRVERVVRAGKGHITLKPMILSPFISKPTGYLQIKVDRKNYNLHRLIAMAFCDGHSDGLVVNHLDGDKQNNAACNLEWTTRSENGAHSYRCLGHVNPYKGKFSGAHPVSKAVTGIDMITGEAFHYASGMDTQHDGFTASLVSACCTGRIKSHGGRYWRFTASNA